MIRFSEDFKRSILIFVSATMVFSMLAYVSVSPRPKEQFFQIYVLGENKMADRYYPNDNPNIVPGTRVRWHLGATNFMGSIQYVILRVKLSNSTIDPPDEKNRVPSPAPEITEFHRVLLNNETWQFPFTWRIDDVKKVGEDYYLRRLSVNERDVQPSPISARKGYNYRIIVEIWTLDPSDRHVMFGWRAGAETRVAWLQIWFNATLPRGS